MNQRGKEENRQRWIIRICEQEESGIPQEEWCKYHNIPYSALKYWRRCLKKEAEAEKQETNWLKVDFSEGREIATVHAAKPHVPMDGINIRIGEFTVELHTGTDMQSAFEVLRMLKAL